LEDSERRDDDDDEEPPPFVVLLLIFRRAPSLAMSLSVSMAAIACSSLSCAKP
jgi:hypothetical protein